jgi:molybdopterin/thiamine biosynthesis adenylyltransferase/rhodanese-related sulfurtransferase
MSATRSDFTPDEIRRYARHFVLPEFGTEGQRRLKEGSVLIVGAGGLGSPLALYLAAAGVGRLGIVDHDTVDPSNLQRQILYGTSAVGKSKIDEAKKRINDLNPSVDVTTYDSFLTSENALEIARPYDIVIDGTDNFPTRYLVNDTCALLAKANVYGSIFRFEGQVSVFWRGHGPCYRCLYSEPPDPGSVPSCAEGGVLGVLPGIIGTLQATEAIKLLTGIGEPLIGRLLIYDALETRFEELRLRRDPACPMCGDTPTISALIDYEEFCGVPRKGQSMAPGSSDREITVEEFHTLRESGSPFLLLDVREPFECSISTLGGINIPMQQVPNRLNELDASQEIIVYCRSGHRSDVVVNFLRAHGFPNTRNLGGGIVAWGEKYDRTMERY